MEEETVTETMTAWAKNYSIELKLWGETWGANHKLTMSTAYKEKYIYIMFYCWHLLPAVVVSRQPVQTAAESDSGKERGPVQESGEDSDEGPASDAEMGPEPSESGVLPPEPPESDSSEAEE
uniref:Uncharacterized protein n=1 Tax=Micrurus corallinus TaxID=54390 RepID=A0A2D4EXQ9_MICCO